MAAFLMVINGFVYENDERGKHEDLIRTLYEEEAFQYLYEYMIGKRR